MASHNELGSWGEKYARECLVAHGYGIIETNWRMDGLEIDIIASKGTRIIFVEVKTRSTKAVDPLKAINAKRINHMVRAANVYVQTYNIPHEVQFDLILIIGKTNEPPLEVEHIPDAFRAPIRTIR